MHSLLKKVSWL